MASGERFEEFADGRARMTIHIPNHVALVMDGNGRWAKQRGLARTAGHEAGEAALFDVIGGAIEYGVKEIRVLVEERLGVTMTEIVKVDG